MADIHVFHHRQFGTLRVYVSEEGKPLFCAIDMARALSFREPSRAVRDFCKGAGMLPTPTPGGVQMMKYIMGTDVDRLISRSGNPVKSEFLSWVNDVVLPALSGSSFSAEKETGSKEHPQDGDCSATEDYAVLLHKFRMLETRYKVSLEENASLKCEIQKLEQELSQFEEQANSHRLILIPTFMLFH